MSKKPYGTAGEYIRHLVREERKRQARVHVEGKLQDALDNGEPRAVAEATWQESDQRVQERIQAASQKRRAHGKTH